MIQLVDYFWLIGTDLVTREDLANEQAECQRFFHVS